MLGRNGSGGEQTKILCIKTARAIETGKYIVFYDDDTIDNIVFYCPICEDWEDMQGSTI